MCVCVVTDISVDARLTVEPSNTAALVGTKVVLRCATNFTHDPPRIRWIRRFDSTTADLRIVLVDYGCVVWPAFTSQYSVNNNETGRCDLVINETTLDMAAKYTCRELETVEVQLTVIGESLVLIVCIQRFVSFYFIYCRVSFYCETLCVSAVFAVARWCLTVCLSVTLVYCIHTAEDVIKRLYWPGSPIILVFFTPSAGTQFKS